MVEAITSAVTSPQVSDYSSFRKYQYHYSVVLTNETTLSNNNDNNNINKRSSIL